MIMEECGSKIFQIWVHRRDFLQLLPDYVVEGNFIRERQNYTKKLQRVFGSDEFRL